MEQKTTTHMGDTYFGLYAGGVVPESIRTGGMDEIGKLAYITKEFTTFAQYFHTKFGSSKRTVKDRVYKSSEISELERYYTVQSDSTDTYHKTFSFTNTEAAQIQPNDMLIRKDVYACLTSSQLYLGQVNANNAVPTSPYTPDMLYQSAGRYITDVVFSRAWGESLSDNNFYIEPEQIMVTSVGAPDSAGTGYTTVTVERCFFGSYDRNTVHGIVGGAMIPTEIKYGPTTGILGQITRDGNANNVMFKTGDILLHAGNAFYEGTNAPEGIWKNPEVDQNFTQELKYAVSYTAESEIIKQWLSDKPIEIHRWLMTKRMMRDYEYMTIFGRSGKHRRADGKEIYTMGGVLEYILKDRDHVLKYKNSVLNWPGLLHFGQEIFKVGGSATRDVFTGWSLQTRLRAMFYESGLLRYNKEESKKFNIEVYSLQVCGGELNIIPSQIMEECGYGMRGIALDLTVPSFVPVTNPGWDMKTETDIAEKGSQIYKEQVITMRGLQRRYQNNHCLLDFSNVA